MKKFIFAFVITLLPTWAFAANFKSDEQILISVPVKDDIYIAGEKVQIKSKIIGDLVVAGEEVEVANEVLGDLTVVAEKALIKSEMRDDVRVAAKEVEVHEKIGDDFIVFAEKVYVLESAEIGGDLVANCGEIRIDGKVHGKLIVNGRKITLNGSVDKDAEINGKFLAIDGHIKGSSELVAEEIELGARASFGNKVDYWTEDGEMKFGTAGATYNEELRNNLYQWKTKFAGIIWGLKITAFLSGVLIIFLFLFMRKFFGDAARKLHKNIWKSFGIGVFYFILTPVAVLASFITLVGIPLGLLVGTMYGFSIFLAIPITAIILASLWEKHSKKKWNKWQIFGASVGTYLVLKILCFIPLLGWLAVVFAVTSAFGAFLMQKMEIAQKFCK